MKTKFITTDKHPELKEGLNIIPTCHNDQITEYCIEIKLDKVGNRVIDVMVREIDYLLAKGYIKELQEPEFTKDDMIDFALYHSDNKHLINNTLGQWLKRKYNEK